MMVIIKYICNLKIFFIGLWDAEPFYYCTNGPTTARGYYVPSDEQSGAGKRQKRGVV